MFLVNFKLSLTMNCLAISFDISSEFVTCLNNSVNASLFLQSLNRHYFHFTSLPSFMRIIIYLYNIYLSRMSFDVSQLCNFEIKLKFEISTCIYVFQHCNIVQRLRSRICTMYEFVGFQIYKKQRQENVVPFEQIQMYEVEEFANSEKYLIYLKFTYQRSFFS